MIRKIGLLIIISLFSFSIGKENINISKQQLNSIAQKIYQNETGGKKENLISWNQGENFVSLGIGHFIWYKYNEPERFEEIFPLLVEFYRSKNIELPWLLRMYRYAPWKTQAEFIVAKKQEQSFKELEAFLLATKTIQIEFIALRLNAALPKLLQHSQQPDLVRQRFSRLVNHPVGLYALIDYINFKGEGVNPNERYKGQGWGLLQVLEGMNDNQELLQSFRDSATRVLTLRVRNSPEERGEGRWLAGWKSRIQSYQ